MPGASINMKTGLWRSKSSGYLFSHKALAQVFRAKILQAIVYNDLRVPEDCPKKWVVDCKDVGNGDKAIIYLGRYLYRGVIREQDILQCENGMVTFRYLHAKTGQYRTRIVTGEYFLLSAHAPCAAKGLSSGPTVLRFSPSMQQKAHRFLADGAQG